VKYCLGCNVVEVGEVLSPLGRYCENKSESGILQCFLKGGAHKFGK